MECSFSLVSSVVVVGINFRETMFETSHFFLPFFRLPCWQQCAIRGWAAIAITFMSINYSTVPYRASTVLSTANVYPWMQFQNNTFSQNQFLPIPPLALIEPLSLLFPAATWACFGWIYSLTPSSYSQTPDDLPSPLWSAGLYFICWSERAREHGKGRESDIVLWKWPDSLTFPCYLAFLADERAWEMKRTRDNRTSNTSLPLEKCSSWLDLLV